MDHIVRIGAIESDTDETKLIFDWNGAREAQSGGSLLAEDVIVPSGGSCKEIWRPVADAGGEVTL
ncbi:hypothetical protein [Amycolatopsis sp. TNS106]|uniref:hypothetical protein n=1 Tax=Amycolatopsis sp. TNS106 TaxID=2861750 RepID=UPI001C5843A1|nr:hypothetical protein [Amycolatopsis sp. TNS106]QXV57427.1 hypothetical protein CVV72_10790 [Amycolatopsis sp. TNS106]